MTGEPLSIGKLNVFDCMNNAKEALSEPDYRAIITEVYSAKKLDLSDKIHIASEIGYWNILGIPVKISKFMPKDKVVLMDNKGNSHIFKLK